MKTIAAVVLSALTSLSAYSQGSFIYGNAASSVGGTGAPVGFLGDQRPGAPAGGPVDRVSGDNFLAQVIVAGVPVPGTVQPFRTGGAAGFLVNTAVVLSGVAGGSTVQVAIGAWWAGWGADYAAAVTASGADGGIGLSAAVPVTLAEAPTPPVGMAGLQPFSISAIVPEPSIASLGLLGAAVFFLRRKK